LVQPVRRLLPRMRVLLRPSTPSDQSRGVGHVGGGQEERRQRARERDEATSKRSRGHLDGDGSVPVRGGKIPDHAARAGGAPPPADWTPAQRAEAFASAGVRKIFSRVLDPRWGARDAMLARLDGSPLDRELRLISNVAYMDSFLDSLADACHACGVDFRRWKDESPRNEFTPQPATPLMALGPECTYSE